MLRLKAEFEKDFPEYHFEIKRGELAPAGKQVINFRRGGTRAHAGTLTRARISRHRERRGKQEFGKQ